MTFSVMLWNLWFDNQIKEKSRSEELLKELKRLTDTYKPDFAGLTEVLQHIQSSTPLVSDFMNQKCGYKYGYYAISSPLNDEWLIGVGLYSLIDFGSVGSVAISKNTWAEKHGYSGQEIQAITASLNLSAKQDLNLILAHPLYLRLDTIKDHYQGTASLEKLIRSDKYSKNTVLVGDFNEPGFMPRSFKRKVRDTLNMRTGSIIKPTWSHNAKSFTPIRANLDQIYWSKNSNFKLKNFEVIKSKISDHKPIFATFEY